jgi:hypothetical protein
MPSPRMQQRVHLRRDGACRFCRSATSYLPPRMTMSLPANSPDTARPPRNGQAAGRRTLLAVYAALKARVERPAQTVADKVERQDGQKDGDARREREPGRGLQEL